MTENVDEEVTDKRHVMSSTKSTFGQKTLASVMLAALALHVILLVSLHHPVTASRFCTAIMPLLAAFCFFWRSEQLLPRERASWWWLSAALVLWSAAQAIEVFVGRSTAASSLVADPADFLYLIAAFPVLLAISDTTETESIRGFLEVNLAQVLLAAGLTYVLLFKTSLHPVAANTAMLKIYVGECALLAIATILRLVTWSTLEERRRMRLLCAVMWIYLPIELSFDYATTHWGLQKGTLFDLLWSVPFLFAGWQALYQPIEDTVAPRRKIRGRKAGLLLQSLCPMLITIGVFALAASIMGQHFLIAIGAMFLLLLIQGLQSGMVQLNYLEGHGLLLESRQELKEANAALERLSLLDPLTGIPNRRQFTAAFESEWKRALRRQESIAVLMVDVDFFKGVNDLLGHAYGDDCLVKIAAILRGELRRANDLVARYGGEEFVVLLPETDRAGAMEVADRMHRAVRTARIVNNASPFDRCITVSIGVSTGQPWSEMNEASLIDSADQALYDAKRLGRNRICVREFQLVIPSVVLPPVS